MTLMTVSNHDEQGKDHRAQPRWSAGKKTDAVLRRLRGELLEEVSRELKAEAHRINDETPHRSRFSWTPSRQG
jgi:hypothetical protein